MEYCLGQLGTIKAHFGGNVDGIKKVVAIIYQKKENQYKYVESICILFSILSCNTFPQDLIWSQNQI